MAGTAVVGYHVTNLAIHVIAALLLFAVVRRTLLLSLHHSLRSATWLACSIALLWAVHPLQTESVTYVIQRAESLAAMLYLLTLYCVIRGAERAGPRCVHWGLN